MRTFLPWQVALAGLLLAGSANVTWAAAPPMLNNRPTCAAEDSEFRDILVSVQEGSTGRLMFGVGINSNSGLTGSVVLNERNFTVEPKPTAYQFPGWMNDLVCMNGFADSCTISQRTGDIDTDWMSPDFGLRSEMVMPGSASIALDLEIPTTGSPVDREQLFNFFMGFSR